MNSALKIRKGKARLLNAVTGGCSLNNLIKIGEEIIGLPMVIATINHFIWYSSGNIPPNHLVPQTAATSINTNFFSLGILDSIMAEESPGYVSIEYKGFYYNFYTLRKNNKIRGYSIIINSSPFSEETLFLHKAFCDILFDELEKQDKEEIILLLSPEENLILHILENPNYAYNIKDLENIFNTPNKYKELIVVKLNKQNAGFSPCFSVINRLKQMLGCQICFGFQNSLVIAADMGTSSKYKKQLEEFAQSNNMIVGVSYPFNWMEHIGMHYRQAEAALMYCEKCGSTMLHFHEVAFFELFRSVHTGDKNPLMYNSYILFLKSYDKENNTEYSRTLYEYIMCNFHATRTAEKLGLHRNSVLARIGRIKEMLSETESMYMDGLFSLFMLADEE
ncbi:MAG TPA: PucR family transcriptional regulator [Clostridiales bacterium]|nr:PucR family transcriptional regulator [Clostridiales bacterium]